MNTMSYAFGVVIVNEVIEKNLIVEKKSVSST